MNQKWNKERTFKILLHSGAQQKIIHPWTRRAIYERCNKTASYNFILDENIKQFSRPDELQKYQIRALK